MPASCKMDTLLAKAEPIGEGGSATQITYLRSRGKAAQKQQRLERVGKNSPADPKVSAEGGGEGAPGTEIPLQPLVQTTLRQHTEVQSGADIHLQALKDSVLEQLKAHRRSLCPCGKPPLEQDQVPDRTCGPMERASLPGADLL
ncbi:hypothetical protein DUI87_24899 [Hirundo rustica rustica]|uniref:Uncharacterized protein n=1 Tax=Hirundo rustica rustica TaxID=333673 RepID=A0A3M0JC52_HIRRU|nr:hypothetical protein DUI87_24899 [Hirundo rustica rustica]